MTLLMLCLSSMMMAIWMKRSVMQPLGWHCEGQRVVSPAGQPGPGAVWPRPVPQWGAGDPQAGWAAGEGERDCGAGSESFPAWPSPPPASTCQRCARSSPGGH